jgi:spermidine synthase
MIGLCTLSEIPFAFTNGYIFGSLSSSKGLRNPYGLESLGALIGSIVLYVCVVLYIKNNLIILLAIVPLVIVFKKRRLVILTALISLGVLLLFNDRSMRWKYPFPFSNVIYGREGELVRIQTNADTTYMLNGSLYKSTMEKASIEQSVHIPMAQRGSHGNALVIYNKGQKEELDKYNGLSIECIESEPRIAAPGSIITSPETFRPLKQYDAILLGATLPQTVASGRLYTVSFFRKMQSLLADSGVFSFSLPLSENYMSPTEKGLYDVLHATLMRVFGNVLIFPGNGYTFMASNRPLHNIWHPQVDTRYLAYAIIPSVSLERIKAANEKPKKLSINTVQRPISLLLGLALWTEQFKNSALIGAGMLLVLFISAIFVVPKSKEILSMGTTGFAVGVYSIALIMLYQSTYGLLYSRISLLLISLTLGFSVGTLIRRIPFPDLFIGLFCLTSLGLLATLPFPPAFLFYCAHCAMGILAGAQFASIKSESAAGLYAADLFGGALGMALCSTLLIPLFGILAVAGGIGLIKIVVGIIGKTNILRYGRYA